MSSSTLTTSQDPATKFKPSIDLIMGPMGSGKTTELLRRINRYEIAKCAVVLIKPSLDTRSGNHIGTHGFRSAGALVFDKLVDACANLYVEGVDVIGVDEGQFFPDLALGCEALTRRGKKVIVAALSGDKEREGFPSVQALTPKCDSVIMLSAICMVCGDEAPFTAYKGKMTGQVIIGDVGMEGEYVPVCRRCYFVVSPSELPKLVPSPREPIGSALV